MSETESAQNPKFIITCVNEVHDTLNLVYLKSDVDNNFSTIAYREGNSQTATVAIPTSPADDELELSPQQLSDARNQCKQALHSRLDNIENISLQADQAIDYRQRRDGRIAVIIEYMSRETIGLGSGMDREFTAICLIEAGDEARIEVYPR